MKEITVEAKVPNITAITAFIDEELEKAGCSMKAQMQLDIAADEIFANVSMYAYAPETGDVTVGLEIDGETKTATMQFRDRGIPFDPTKAEEPDVTLPAEKRRIGGLGIFMVKKSMDSVNYEYRDGQNILTITKKIG
jgi:anti-sigma regulatory factor (Ser/Thr protein kinase)